MKMKCIKSQRKFKRIYMRITSENKNDLYKHLNELQEKTNKEAQVESPVLTEKPISPHRSPADSPFHAGSSIL
jgi:hypothetical protein